MTPSDVNRAGRHPIADAVRPYADAIVEWLEAHELERHAPGERCITERANALGYLAHRIGADQEVFIRMLAVFDEYQHRHRDLEGGPPDD